MSEAVVDDFPLSPEERLKLGNQLCFPLYAAAKEVVRRYTPLLDLLGLTYTQYLTMMVLWEKETVSVSELGAELYLDSGTLTPLLKKMESKGLIARRRSSADERRVEVAVTEEGAALREKALGVPPQMASCMDLDADEAALLGSLLHKLLDNVRESERE
ncbi:MAG: MarR family transcriptional regulator [Berryella intestinalis]|uniref:MarR family winged helix-turn-helix transcriptional regulator n=1 Tax=Berryella intestinalis TaxID=1531429 RepID=UPI002A4EEFD2|nr:MarR family transcriptional regulator [Berryella intestinalis]MDD7369781.1 MarR family transcriptional regulator [Berryella intestinalis]MDY3129518.1 MarR family transcriptional regulator [Berryella intestinalis]